MRILALSRYDASGASSRYRVYQYLPYLRSMGLQIDEAPLLGEDYVRSLYGGATKRPLALLWSGLKRLYWLLGSRQYDLLWMEKELFPFLPDFLERPLLRRGTPVVVDYDDAIFHRYDTHRSSVVRGLLGKKIDGVMARATLVVAGNQYIADHATAAGARQVAILPTVINLDRYPTGAPSQRGRPFSVGWIGSPSTQDYLLSLAPVLSHFCQESGGVLSVVGVSGSFRMPGVPLKPVAWSSDTEAASIRSFDVGIMPLPDASWERGKCGFKLIQYMGCSVPVIASPVGVNSSIVLPGQTGLLAEGPEEWLAALTFLARSEEARLAMGAAGRTRAEDHYSLASASPRLLRMLVETARAGRASELKGS